MLCRQQNVPGGDTEPAVSCWRLRPRLHWAALVARVLLYTLGCRYQIQAPVTPLHSSQAADQVIQVDIQHGKIPLYCRETFQTFHSIFYHAWMSRRWRYISTILPNINFFQITFRGCNLNLHATSEVDPGELQYLLTFTPYL